MNLELKFNKKLKKILHSAFCIHNSLGFTLIELLVVIAIMGILGLILTNTITQTLRGQNKTKVIGAVKQNGQVVLDRISNEIRQAEKVFCVNGDVQANWDTIILFKKGTYTKIRFYSPSSSTNGKITIYSQTIDPSMGAAPSCSDPTSPDEQNLSDVDTRNGVSLDFDPLTLPGRTPGEWNSGPPETGDRVFIRSQQAGYADTITIKFRGMPAINSGKTYENMVTEGGVLFTTSVQVRGGKV